MELGHLPTDHSEDVMQLFFQCWINREVVPMNSVQEKPGVDS